MSRFALPQDDAFRALNDSISFDRRLGDVDVEQSIAHVSMLAAQGIIGDEDRDALQRALRQIAGESETVRSRSITGDEDIHMAVERRVGEIAGRAVGKLHTARSRNDRWRPMSRCSCVSPR